MSRFVRYFVFFSLFFVQSFGVCHVLFVFITYQGSIQIMHYIFPDQTGCSEWLTCGPCTIRIILKPNFVRRNQVVIRDMAGFNQVRRINKLGITVLLKLDFRIHETMTVNFSCARDKRCGANKTQITF